MSYFKDSIQKQSPVDEIYDKSGPKLPSSINIHSILFPVFTMLMVELLWMYAKNVISLEKQN